MYIYGKNVVLETLKNNDKILKAYVLKSFNDQTIISSLQKQGIKINWLDKYDLDKLVKNNHQGIILEVPEYKYANIENLISNEDCILVILDHLEDPHNFGAIIRTCETAGVKGIIIPKDRSVNVNSTVMKVSAGALNKVPIAMVTNLSQTIDYLQKKGFWIIGADLGGDNYNEIDYSGKIAIVVGNEGVGLSKIIRNKCDFIATIPMYGQLNSLNVSVACGIILYQAKLERRRKGEI